MLTPIEKSFRLLIAIIAMAIVFGLFAFNAVNIAHAQVTPEAGLATVGTAAGLQAGQDIRVIIGNVIKVILGFLGAMALIIVLYAGFLYMTSGGDQEKAQKARRWLVNGVIGLVIIFSAYAITSFIITKIKAAISGEEIAVAGGGPGGLEIGGGINVFSSKQILPNTPAAVNYPVKIYFSKGADSTTINKDNVQIIKKGAKGKVGKTLAPVEIIEKNGKGADILSKLIISDDQFTGWDVCLNENSSEATKKISEGYTPMSVIFDISELKGKKLSLSSYKIENKNSPGGRFTISCGDKNNPAKIVIKEKWASSDKPFTEKVKNSLEVPKECFNNAADNKLYIQWKRSGTACIKFDYMALEVEYEDYVGAESAVAGKFETSGSTVKFTPGADCTDPACKGQKCFDKNSEYQVSLKSSAIKSNTGIGLSCAAGSVCLHNFETNEVCDVNAPAVSFIEPWDGAKVSQDADVDVTIKATDDGGISYIDFFAADKFQDKAVPTSGKNELEFYGYFSWNTEDVVLDAATKKAVKKLKAITEDLDAHSASKEIEVTVLPAYCFDSFGSVICDKDSTKPECGACDGADCSSNSDCAGTCVKKCQDATAYTCSTNKDCASGVACGGTCETPPVITNVAPDTAGPGNYVTIYGKGFLSYQEGKSKLYFSGADGEYLEAAIVKCGTAGKPSWSSNQIIVKVPEKAGTGPLKVVNYEGKEDSTVDDDGWKGEFEFDPKIKYPGLCAVQLEKCNPTPTVLCDEGVVGDFVKLIGDNFGSEMADNDMIYFGDAPAGQGAGFSWTNKEIKGIQIPVVAPHWYGVTVAKEDSQDATKKVNSNPVYFQVIPAANLPKIDKITPSPAPLGQMVTISGQYFGKDMGYVEFRRFIDGQPYDWVAGLACAGSSWSDSEIIIKVPKEIVNTISKLEGASEYSKDYQITVYNSKGLGSEPVGFEIINAAPGPGLCSLYPNNGPVGTKFNLTGENFGASTDYYIKFQTADKKQVSVTNFGTWSEKLIEKAGVPAGAVSGAVYLESNAADAIVDKSNSLNFSVGSCKKDSCAEGFECCADGICKSKCVAPIEYSPSEYMWLVSTGPLPILPQVLERTCLIGVYSQSPSPFKSTEDACPNGLISATFNMAMNAATYNNNIEVRRCLLEKGGKCDFTVCTAKEQKEKKCNVAGQVKCLSDGTCVGGIVKNLANDAGESVLYSGCQTKDGKECQLGKPDCVCNSSTISKFNLHESLADLADSKIVKGSAQTGFQLFENTWYQVIIKGGQENAGGELTGGVVSSTGKSMAADYVWTFKTKNENCVPENLLLEPFIGLISDLYGKQKYIVSGEYQCQVIALDGENWQWGVQESYKDKILFAGYGCKGGVEADICQSTSTDKRPDIGVYKLNTEKVGQGLETAVGKPAIIHAEAKPKDDALKKVFDNLYKEGGLEIKFAAPKIISYYPSCQSACINAEIGAHFSAQMNEASLSNTNNVKLYSCASAECVNLTPVNFSTKEIEYQWTQPDDTGKNQVSNLKVNLKNDLSPNTFYRVVITNGVKSSSQKPLAGLNYKTENAPAGDCGDWQDNDADGKVDVSGGYIYKGDDDGKLDFVCGCYDTTAKKFLSYNKIEDKVNCSENTSLTCLKIDWETINGKPKSEVTGEITDAEQLKEITTENNYFSPDSECAGATDFEIGKSGAFDAFSWVFKTKASSEKCEIDKVEVVPVEYTTDKQGEKIEYWSNPYSAPDECSEKGQLLKPFDYGWTWDSTVKAVADVTHTGMMEKTPDYCTENCLAKGSAPVEAVCGNGKIETGEECDDKNILNDDGCSDKCLFEPLKTFKNCSFDLPDLKAVECCGNGVIDTIQINGQSYTEECDAFCTNYDEKSNCIKMKESYCSPQCLNTGTAAGFVCGNGKMEAGEDKDDGNNKNGDGVSSICLNEGAKYKIGEKGESPVVCGDGVIGYGEECEAIVGGDGKLSLNNNKYCTDKCTWVGFPACGKCEKKVVDQMTGKETITACLPTDAACGCYHCCGNAQYEDYDNFDIDNNIGTGADEECEANAVSCKVFDASGKNIIKDANGQEKLCNTFGVGENLANGEKCICEPIFPEWCSTKCMNLGSSYKYGSYCGDGKQGSGEDNQCEVTTAGTKGAPYQVATTSKPMDFSSITASNMQVFTFNIITKFVEGATKIIATTTQNNAEKKGEADLTYRTNDPDVLAQFCSTELGVAFNNDNSAPQPDATDICRNALLSFQFDKILDTTNGAVALYKVVGTTESLVESTFTATSIGGKTHIVVTPKSLLDATTLYKVKLFNIKNVCGFYYSPWTLSFTTGAAICKLDTVKIEPSETIAVMPNQIHLFQAFALSGAQTITEVSGAYEWDLKWSVDDTTIANSPVIISGTNDSSVNVTSLSKNGTATVFAEAEITKDANLPDAAGEATSTVGIKISASAKLMVLICQNLWKPSSLTNPWTTWDIPASSVLAQLMSIYVYEKNYNIGLLYCRDFGGPALTDDLPGLKIVGGGDCNDGIDNDGDGKIDSIETKAFTSLIDAIVDSDEIQQEIYQQVTLTNKIQQSKKIGIYFNKTNEMIVLGKLIFSFNIEIKEGANSLGKATFIGIENNKPRYFFINNFLGYTTSAFKFSVQKDTSGSEASYNLKLDFLANDDSDPECKSIIGSESSGGNLLTEYLLTRDGTVTDNLNDNSTDVIALRIYKNPEFLPPEVWYQKYAPNPADTTGSLMLDCQKDEFGEFCYPAAVDPPSVYVGASNLAGNDIYNNIYILSHSQNANEATLNIFNQLVAYLRFNFNLGDLSKVSLIRDTKRIQDMVLTRLYIEQYQQTHNGNAPALESGTYERGMSFSVWPSWQNELGATLKQVLPVDPLNHFKWEKSKYVNTGMPCLNELKCLAPVAEYQCVVPEKYCVKCPVGYDKTTCYDSSTQKFFNYYSNPDDHPVYSYQFDPMNTGNKSAYKIDFMLEITSKTYQLTPKF